VLETVAVGSQNGTMDQMITPSGDVVSLDNVTAANLLDVFCDKNTGGLQPRECILRDI
jgi:hypothetical protein